MNTPSPNETNQIEGKKRPGRPRKVQTAQQAPSAPKEMKRPGRRRKGASESPEQGKPGRRRKAASESPEQGKPGRRRKATSESPAPSPPAETASGAEAPKKRRGRKPKAHSAEEQARLAQAEAERQAAEAVLAIPAALDRPFLQSCWFQRQGLPHLVRGTVAQTLERTGWLPLSEGPLSYLALFARARLPRAGVDEALVAGTVVDVPAIGGRTMLVPASDLALALTVGRAFHETEVVEVARQACGLLDPELERLSEAVLSVLSRGPVESGLLPDLLPEGLVRNLGEPGKKKGFATTLPIALGRLQTAGQVRRVSFTGRLDSPRFLYALWQPGLIAAPGFALSEPTPGKRPRPEFHAELALRYLRWAAPVTPRDFALFAGLGQWEARAAFGAVAAVPVEPGDERMILPGDLEALDRRRRGRPVDLPRIAFLPPFDNLALLHRDPIYLDPAHCEIQVPDWQHGPKRSVPATRLGLAVILDRGRLIGFWDFDDQQREIVWAPLQPLHRVVRQAVHDELAVLQSFIRDELGEVRFDRQDNDRHRRHRLASISALADRVGK